MTTEGEEKPRTTSPNQNHQTTRGGAKNKSDPTGGHTVRQRTTTRYPPPLLRSCVEKARYISRVNIAETNGLTSANEARISV